MNKTFININSNDKYSDKLDIQYIALAMFIGIIFITYMRYYHNVSEELDEPSRGLRENNSITIDILDQLPNKSVLPESKYFQKRYVKDCVIDPSNCPICLEDMQEENIHLLQWQKCGHIAHIKCMTEWINTKGSDIRCLTCHKPV